MELVAKCLSVLTLAKGNFVDLVYSNGSIAVSWNGSLLDKVEAGQCANEFIYRKKLQGVVLNIKDNEVTLKIIHWADLHRHSGYSLLDGATHIKDMVEKTEYVGALTDHGVMFGVLDYYKKMKSAGKKPILGFEAYSESVDGKKERNHLLLLAKNEVGFKNLIKLTSMAYENFYGKPHVSYEMLRDCSEGVIATSACIGGEIPQLLLRNKLDEAKRVIIELSSIFGRDDFYLEIQRHGIENEQFVNSELIQLAKELGLKIVATSDAHYTNKEDSYTHEILLCLQTGKTMSDPTHMKFSGSGYHLQTWEEIERLFSDIPEALDNTLEIAEKCNVELDLSQRYMPEFKVPDGFTEDSYFEYLCKQGFEKRFKGTEKYDDPAYRERLDYEVKVIIQMGFPGYFLIVWDFVKFAKDNGIMVGPGRGSCVGSLASFCLEITELDPIPFGLLFERFLNPERISMPDIDMDFQDERRDEVINYVRQKYGDEAVSKIVTFGTLGAKAVVRDVTRVLDYPYSVGDKIAKTIPVAPHMTLKKAMEESVEFLNLYNTDSEVKTIVDVAMKLEGLPRHSSQHACFDANTLVTTSQGLKRIVDIQLGDEVLTHNRRFKPVIDSIITETDRVYTLKAVSSFPIEVTGNHPMYVREMSIKHQKNEKKNSTKVRTWGEPKWKAVEDLTVGVDYVGIPINQESIIPEYDNLSLPFENKSFWWVIGRYVGDGWTENPKYDVDGSKWENRRVVICCTKKSESEKEQITAKFEELGLNYWVEEANTTYKIHVNNSLDLYEYLQSFGKYAYGKYLNKDIVNLPKELLSSFLLGYMGADGSYHEMTDRFSFKTVSKKLAIGLMQVINKVYNRPTNITILPEKTEFIEGRKVKSKEKYQIWFTKDTRRKERCFYENGYIWARISSFSQRVESKLMYNLTVLDDSSYVVHGLCAHNCGVIIAPSAVRNYIPELILENSDGIKERTIQWNMVEAEESGLLKMDFLGLRTMNVIGHALEQINEKRLANGETPIGFLDIPLNDKKVYEYIATGETFGVFQLESPGMRSFMKDLYQDAYQIDEKDSFQLFERLIAGVALYRPGPMDSIPQYIENMRNPEYIQYDVPQLKSILEATYGVIIYQEQVMEIVRTLAGYSMGRSDLVRRAMGKKKKEVMEKEQDYFINGKTNDDGSIDVPGCVRNGVPKDIAEKIWDIMAKFAEYAFNKSHAAGYAVIANATAWLKYYYPVEFMTSIFNSFITNADKLKGYLSVCKNMNIKILPPDVNKSKQIFKAEDDGIRFGLMGIKNMGKVSENIISERNERDVFKGFQDFAERMAKYFRVDKRVLEALVYSGAVDGFPGTRRAKLSMLGQILDMASQSKADFLSGQISLFDISEDFSDLKEIQIPEMEEFPKKAKLEKEKEYAGFYVTEHPLDDYAEYFKRENVLEIGFLQHEDTDELTDDGESFVATSSFNGQTVKIAGIIKDLQIFYTKRDQKPLYVFTIEDKTAEMKAVIFEDRIPLNQDKLVEGKVVIVQGQIKEDDRGTQIIVRNMFDIEAIAKSEKPKSVWVKILSQDQFKTLNDIIVQHKGNLPVYIRYNNKNFQANYNIELTFASFTKLQEAFGNFVKVVYEK